MTGRIPTKGDRVKVIQQVPPWYFLGELARVAQAAPEAEFVEIILDGTSHSRIAHTSHLEVLP